MRGPCLLVAAALLGATGSPAANPSPDAQALDPALVLPPPPAANGPVAQDELAALHRVDSELSPAELAAARRDDATKDGTIFRTALGPGFDLDRLPVTRALLETVRTEEKAAVDRAKVHFARPRPWIADAGLHPCSTNDAPLSSYPSGHTTMGYAMAAVLARLVPARAPAVMARAASYARSRLVCEMHFPSDVAAGQVLGMLVAERLVAQPAFAARMTAAVEELRGAGLDRTAEVGKR